jgi:hypothetical protein
MSLHKEITLRRRSASTSARTAGCTPRATPQATIACGRSFPLTSSPECRPHSRTPGTRSRRITAGRPAKRCVDDAVDQYRFDRLPRPKGQNGEPLLSFPHGALVHFAVSNREARMTTKLEGAKTAFLPFNQGDHGAAGNPVNPRGHRTAYLWEQVWARESWLEILGRYLIARRDSKNTPPDPARRTSSRGRRTSSLSCTGRARRAHHDEHAGAELGGRPGRSQGHSAQSCAALGNVARSGLDVGLDRQPAYKLARRHPAHSLTAVL